MGWFCWCRRGFFSPWKSGLKWNNFFSSSSVSCYSRQRCGIKTLLLLGGRRLIAQASGILSSRVQHTPLLREEKYLLLLSNAQNALGEAVIAVVSQTLFSELCISYLLPEQSESIHSAAFPKCILCGFYFFCLLKKFSIAYSIKSSLWAFPLHISAFSHAYQMLASNNYSLFLNSLPSHRSHPLCLERPQ